VKKNPKKSFKNLFLKAFNINEDDVYWLVNEENLDCKTNYTQYHYLNNNSNSYKLKLKNMFDNICITDCNIGHTSLFNTTEQQVLDSTTEFYILSKSDKIIMASYSGFSTIASKFQNIPTEYLCI
jgi:hypothetical protein